MTRETAQLGEPWNVPGEGVRKNLAELGLVLDYYGERFEGVGFALNMTGKEAKLILRAGILILI